MKKEIKTIELFRTKDLAIAAVLYASSQKLDSTEPGNQGQKFFVFENKPVCESLTQKHYSGDLMINSRQIVDALKTLKSIIFNS